jgi:hypothetical protein
MAVYKIRNSKGHYSTGGHSPSFTAAGKSWSKLGQVKAHLTNYCRRGYYGHARDVAIPEDWVVVEFEEAAVLGPAWAVHAKKGK